VDLIGNDDEVEETSGLDGDNGFEIMWDSQVSSSHFSLQFNLICTHLDPQPQRNLDWSLLHELRILNTSRHVMQEHVSHYVIRGGDFYKIEVEPVDLDRILASKGRLNGEGLNGVAASLHIIFSNPHSPHALAATQCALLSTYDLPRVHFKASDANMWRFLGPTEYWTKSLWLIPIHWIAQEHWVCAVVDVRHQSIYFFDSFAERSGWHRDLRVSLRDLPLYPNLTLSRT
jgi:hypothetical protein